MPDRSPTTRRSAEIYIGAAKSARSWSLYSGILPAALLAASLWLIAALTLAIGGCDPVPPGPDDPPEPPPVVVDPIEPDGSLRSAWQSAGRTYLLNLADYLASAPNDPEQIKAATAELRVKAFHEATVQFNDVAKTDFEGAKKEAAEGLRGAVR